MSENSHEPHEPHEQFLAFPEAELVELAEHFDLIAEAWLPLTANGRRLRSEHQARAQVCREAIVAYRQLAGLPPLMLRNGEPILDLEADATGTARAD